MAHDHLSIRRPHGSLSIEYDQFDSQHLGIAIGRVTAVEPDAQQSTRDLYRFAKSEAAAAGYQQLLRRTSLTSMVESHILTAAGFVLVDIGLQFSIESGRVPETAPAIGDTPVIVDHASESMLTDFIPHIVQEPWNSRYENDPTYSTNCITTLRSHWLWNSFHTRADAFFVGLIDNAIAGYATCRVLKGAAVGQEVGQIELVGTLAPFRGRGVAARVVHHALTWLSERTRKITVRTQANNYSAVRLYERCGFTLDTSDMTYRISLD